MLADRKLISNTAHCPPEILAEDAAFAHDQSWWLLHTRSRQEKSLATELSMRGLGYYLPLITRRSLTRGRPRDAMVPLFPSYVFLWGDDATRVAALKTNRVAAAHLVANGEELANDLRSIAKLISKGAPLTPEARMVPGQKVRVKTGLFAGYEGEVFKRHGKTKLVVWVRHVLQGASVEIDDFCLEPI